jgi:hypothetical protein
VVEFIFLKVLKAGEPAGARDEKEIQAGGGEVEKMEGGIQNSWVLFVCYGWRIQAVLASNCVHSDGV